MTKQKWVTRYNVPQAALAQDCEQLTDEGYWIYGVWPIDGYGFQILACKSKEDVSPDETI